MPSKVCKPDDFESHDSLNLRLTDIQHLCLNFVGCESFLESNSSDMFAVYETDLKDSIDSSSIFVRCYLSLIGKDTLLKCIAYVKEGLAFAWDSSLENFEYPYLCFQLVFFCSVFYFYSIYRLNSSCFCSILDAISSSIDEILSMNPSANVFVFGDFNVHHNNSLTYSDGTDRLYICSTEAFSWLRNCDQTFWLSFHWFSFRFKRDVPFYCADGDNPRFNWESLWQLKRCSMGVCL